ncbi:MAG: hypothetical protein AAF790_11015 [Planctomycetota bacterium]
MRAKYLPLAAGAALLAAGVSPSHAQAVAADPAAPAPPTAGNAKESAPKDEPGARGQPDAAEAWRAYLPAGWLAICTAPGDLDSLEVRVEQVLLDLAFDYTPVLDSIRTAAGLSELSLTSDRLVVGLAKPGAQAKPDADGEPVVFAMLPLADFAGAVERVGGEITGEVGVATLLGVDLCLAPCDRWVLVGSLDNVELLRAAAKQERGATPNPAAGVIPPGPATHTPDDVAVEFSASGLAWLQERAERAPGGNRRRWALRGLLRWPPTVAALDAAVATNPPLVGFAQRRLAGVHTGVAATPSGGLRWRTTATLLQRPASQAGSVGRSLPAGVAASAIGSLRGSGRGPAADTLSRLLLAYTQGRSDEIGADRFPADAYARFADAAAAALRQVQWFDAAIVHRDTGLPLYSNQAALLTVDDADQLAASLRVLAARWNEVVEASEAETALRFDATDFNRDGLRGVEFSVDMLEALDVGVSEEIKLLLERFYGSGGVYSWRLVAIPGRVDGQSRAALLTDFPWPQAATLAKQIQASPKAANASASNATPRDAWSGTLCPTGYLEWQQRVTNALRGRPIPKPTERPEGGRPRLSFQASVDGLRLNFEAMVNRDGLRAAGASLVRGRGQQ